MMRDLAKLQKASKDCLDELEAAVLPVLTAKRMEDQLDEVLFSTEVDVLGLGDVLKELRSPEARAKIVFELRELGDVESEDGVPFVHSDWQGDNVHRGPGESESYCFFQSFIGLSTFGVDFGCNSKELKAYANELGASLEQAERGKAAARKIGMVQYLFHVFHQNRGAADSQADKYFFRIMATTRLQRIFNWCKSPKRLQPS